MIRRALFAAIVLSFAATSAFAQSTLPAKQVAVAPGQTLDQVLPTKEAAANKGQPNGYAGLGPDGKVPAGQLPPLGTASAHAASDFDSAGAASAAIAGLPTLARTGAYADLTGKPTLGTASAHAATDFDAAGSAASVQALLAPVATSGAYSSLTGLPTLGGAAGLNVGTGAGTVAAGNDSRIVNAVQQGGAIDGLTVSPFGKALSPAAAFTGRRLDQVQLPIAFDGGSATPTDNLANLTALLVGGGQYQNYVCPANAGAIGVSGPIPVTVANTKLSSEGGCKFRLLSAGASAAAVITTSANNTTLESVEIDGGSYGSNVTGFKTISTSGYQPTGVRVIRANIHDVTGYCINAPDNADITITDPTLTNCTRNAIIALNGSGVGPSRVEVDRPNIDRSMVPASATGYPNIQIWGTATYPAHQIVTEVVNNKCVINPSNPTTGGNAEGMELRYGYGEVDGYDSTDCSIGLSVAQNSYQLNLTNLHIKGANTLGLEIGAPGTGGQINVDGCVIDGLNAGGAATTGRAIALDGTANAINAHVNITNCHLSGFTNDGLFANFGWYGLTFSNIQCDLGSVTGAAYANNAGGDTYCINLAGNFSHAGPESVGCDNITADGENVAAAIALQAVNVIGLRCSMMLRNFPGTAIQVKANSYPVDGVTLALTRGAGMSTGNIVSVTQSTPGLLGSVIVTGGDPATLSISTSQTLSISTSQTLASVSANQTVLVTTGGADLTETLPALGMEGQQITLRKADTGAGRVIVPNQVYLNVQGDLAVFRWDNTSAAWTNVDRIIAPVEYTYTTPGSYTLTAPLGYLYVDADAIGGGGSGGSGAAGDSTAVRTGGGGGGAGGRSRQRYQWTDISSTRNTTIAITIPAIAVGGAGVAGATGNAGVIGGAVSAINNTTSLTFISAGGGLAGGYGSTVASVITGGSVISDYPPNAGGTSTLVGAGSMGGYTVGQGPGAAGAGGTLPTSGTTAPGGDGGKGYRVGGSSLQSATGTGGVGGTTAAGGAGVSGGDAAWTHGAGAGGGGGGSGLQGGGAGGNGGKCGGAGGGGGATRNGYTSGPGGNGGSGCLTLTFYFK